MRSETEHCGYRLARVMVDGKVRFVPQHRGSLQPSITLSIYEAYLNKKHSSHGTVHTALNKCLYLWVWADEAGIGLDELLLQGMTLEPRQVNAFCAWLETREGIRTGKPISPGVYNSALSHISLAMRWFAEQYATFTCTPVEREIQRAQYLAAIASRFADKRIKEVRKKEAGDLTEEEITRIEHFLRPDLRTQLEPKTSLAQILRDYLVWRLVVEFGLREGEVLTLRLEDCPHRDRNGIRVVRVEERGEDYADPRAPYAPRPKTLSRELGFVLKNSPIPSLITEYVTRHRRRKVEKHGRKVYQPILDVPAFLILSHHNDKGDPLSLSSMQDVARTIREGSGVKHFHWHIGRHAFFNRAYSSILHLKEKEQELYEDRIRDLVYWGGWESEDSLQLYVNRARRERAEKALVFYQSEGNEWAALS